MTQPITVQWHDHHAVVSLPSEIDLSNADAVQESLTSVLAEQPAALIADLSETTFCDSAGVRAVMIACRRAAEAQCKLQLVISSPGILRSFLIVGADQRVPIHSQLCGALPFPPGRFAGAADGQPAGGQ